MPTVRASTSEVWSPHYSQRDSLQVRPAVSLPKLESLLQLCLLEAKEPEIFALVSVGF